MCALWSKKYDIYMKDGKSDAYKLPKIIHACLGDKIKKLYNLLQEQREFVVETCLRDLKTEHLAA